MKAMILAAGLGTRLRPLTNQMPKALAAVGNKTLLEIVIDRLVSAGFDEIIINVHHHSNLIIKYLEEKKNFGKRIYLSDETDLLLDTGGGLLKAAHLLKGKEPFLVHNVDVLTNIDLAALYKFHLDLGDDVLATLAVNNREAARVFLVNSREEICGWRNNKTSITVLSRNDVELHPFSFCGIHVINPQLFDLIEEQGVFSMIELYLRLASSHIIKVWHCDAYKWLDVGTAEDLRKGKDYIF